MPSGYLWSIRAHPAGSIPFFCYQIFDFALNTLVAVTVHVHPNSTQEYMRKLPSNFPYRDNMMSVNPTCLILIILLFISIILIFKGSLISCVGTATDTSMVGTPPKSCFMLPAMILWCCYSRTMVPLWTVLPRSHHYLLCLPKPESDVELRAWTSLFIYQRNRPLISLLRWALWVCLLLKC